MYCSKSTD